MAIPLAHRVRPTPLKGLRFFKIESILNFSARVNCTRPTHRKHPRCPAERVVGCCNRRGTVGCGGHAALLPPTLSGFHMRHRDGGCANDSEKNPIARSGMVRSTPLVGSLASGTTAEPRNSSFTRAVVMAPFTPPLSAAPTGSVMTVARAIRYKLLIPKSESTTNRHASRPIGECGFAAITSHRFANAVALDFGQILVDMNCHSGNTQYSDDINAPVSQGCGSWSLTREGINRFGNCRG